MAFSFASERVVASMLALFAFALFASAAADAPEGARTAARPPPRLVAVADLHGDLVHTRRSLQLAGVSEDGERWSAGANTHFVQTGDVLDRGERSVEITRLLAGLREDARDAGSEVTTLLGNHELLTLQGDYRYVAREEIVRLGRDSLESKQLGGEAMGTGYGLRAYWAAGQMAWREAFAPGAELGKEIRMRRPVATVAGEGACATLFAHAGVRRAHLASHGDSVEALNAFARDAIAAVSARETRERHRARRATTDDDDDDDEPPPLATLDVFDVESPVWTRFWSDEWGQSVLAETTACAELDEILSLVGAARMVVGHTVQPTGMTTRCDGRLHLIDVGISDKYVGRGAAWTCEGGTVRAQYDGKTVVLERARTVKGSETGGDARPARDYDDDDDDDDHDDGRSPASGGFASRRFGRSETSKTVGADTPKTEL